MQVEDAEFGRFTTSAGMTFGSSLTGNIYVDGVTDGNSDSIATLTLITTQPAREVTFETGASSFNKGMTVQAVGGAIMTESVSTKNWPTTFWTGTGTLTVAASMTFSTTSQSLLITADDFDLRADTAKRYDGCCCEQTTGHQRRLRESR